MATPIWQLLYATQPDVLLRLIGRGWFVLQSGEQITVRLGDSAQRLMRARAYRRMGRRLREVTWE